MVVCKGWWRLALEGCTVFRWLVPEDLVFYHTLQQWGMVTMIQGQHVGGAISNAKEKGLSRKEKPQPKAAPKPRAKAKSVARPREVVATNERVFRSV